MPEYFIGTNGRHFVKSYFQQNGIIRMLFQKLPDYLSASGELCPSNVAEIQFLGKKISPVRCTSCNSCKAGLMYFTACCCRRGWLRYPTIWVTQGSIRRFPAINKDRNRESRVSVSGATARTIKFKFSFPVGVLNTGRLCRPDFLIFFRHTYSQFISHFSIIALS